MCVSSGGTYDKATQACTCSGDLILDNNTKMCVFDQEKANQQKCVADGGEWIVENGSGYCKKEETNTYPIVVDKNNPNFIHAAYMLGGEEGDGLFDVFNKLENLEDIIKNAGYGRTLKPGDYFYYNKTLYRVVNQINLNSWSKADSIIKSETLFNVSASGDYVKGKQYHSGEYVLLDQTWYTPSNETNSTPPDKEWHECGTDPAKFEGVCKVDNNK